LAKQEELVKARDEAVAGERAKADLVAVMSHEMRTPLNGIVGALELLKSTDLDKTQSSMTDVMGTSAEMLLQHVNDVLDMSRLEAGAAEIIRRPFDPVAVTNELLGSLGMAAQDRSNVLELKVLSPDFNLVLGDPGKLRQILTNLVGNAIKFTKHGTITVEIEHHIGEGEWELRIADEGIGISLADQERVFEDFVTLDPSYTRAQEGTGLGLAIVRRLVEHLGGDIGVESEDGTGSVFWVRLPTNIFPDASVVLHQSDKTATAMRQATLSSDLSIMLVEDNEINRVIAREMLSKLGHSCVEAHDGAEAVELAKLRKFDAILMDISMPGIDGVEATKRIKTEDGPNAQTPIFAVTAHAMPSDVERFTAAGMEDVLVKPISIDRLTSLFDGQSVLAATADVTTPYWDEALLNDLLLSIGQDKLNELMNMFIAEMDEACRSTLAPSASHMTAELRPTVHKLAGSAALLGATKLRHVLHEVEEQLSKEIFDDVSALLDQALDCWTETREAVPGGPKT